MNPIDELFSRLRSRHERAFIPFVVGGDPSPNVTETIVRELDSAGCHIVEIGFPFSDPIADGPTIQAAYTRALERGVRVNDIFSVIERLKREPSVKAPIVGMISYTLVHRRGVQSFVDNARRAGVSGIIVPDLPLEEAAEFASVCDAAGVCSIMLVAPTTPPDRAERIARLSRGFLYCMSVAGITGERDRIPDALLIQLSKLRSMTDLPLCVGFGISRPEHVEMLRSHADGVIVGSAIVRSIEHDASSVRRLVEPLLHALNPN